MRAMLEKGGRPEGVRGLGGAWDAYEVLVGPASNDSFQHTWLTAEGARPPCLCL